TSPIWTRTATSCPTRIVCGSSSWAIGCGIRTARSVRCLRAIRCCSAVCCRPVAARYSLLSGRVLPSWGANTEFADMRAAYDALDQRTKAEVEDLVCLHSLIYSRHASGFTGLN